MGLGAITLSQWLAESTESKDDARKRRPTLLLLCQNQHRSKDTVSEKTKESSLWCLPCLSATAWSIDCHSLSSLFNFISLIAHRAGRECIEEL